MRSPFMTTAEVAERLRFLDANGQPDVKNAWTWLQRQTGIRRWKRGRITLVHVDDIDACLVPANAAAKREREQQKFSSRRAS